jgi:hypothetical protein
MGMCYGYDIDGLVLMMVTPCYTVDRLTRALELESWVSGICDKEMWLSALLIILMPLIS